MLLEAMCVLSMLLVDDWKRFGMTRFVQKTSCGVCWALDAKEGTMTCVFVVLWESIQQRKEQLPASRTFREALLPFFTDKQNV